MANKIAARMEMSLRDVEPVKGFIEEMIGLRNRFSDGISSADFDAAFTRLYRGFGEYHAYSHRSHREACGWRIPPERVPFVEREKWPSVCVVVPVYNAPELLATCLSSLATTDYPRMHVACVDNGSDDPETVAMVRDALRLTPGGFAWAVNAGMRANPGFDYYVLFNQDCEVIETGWLKQLVNFMEYRPNCAVAGAKLLYPDGTLQHAGIAVPKGSCGMHPFLRKDPERAEVNAFEKMPAVTGAVLAIRASALPTVGCLDEGYSFGCEDTDYCLRTAAHGREVWYVPTAVVRHVDNGVRKAEPTPRLAEWVRSSDARFRRLWGKCMDLCAEGRAAIVLPDWNPVAGGCRVAGALANTLANLGMRTTVYTLAPSRSPDDPDYPRYFDIRPLSELCGEPDLLIATRFDTVRRTRSVGAKRKVYLVQQIETPMAKYCGASEADVLDSYRQTEYEILTIGEHLARQLAEMGRSARVLDVGLYTDLYPFVPERGGRSVLMYASPADYKGGGDASELALSLRREIPGVRILSFHRDFEKAAWSDEHFQPRSTGEVAAVYAKADVYVYASHSDGFAMTPVEAMCCGTPVVLTDFPGKDQYARHRENCLVARFRDFDGVAGYAAELLDDSGLWRRLQEAGRETALNYDWRGVGLQYLRELLEVPV
ncbi:MAG: glycosyltransferase [Armatimonadota bacterium]